MGSGNTNALVRSVRPHARSLAPELEQLRRMPPQDRIIVAHDYSETSSLAELRFLRDHDAIETIREAARRSLELRTGNAGR